MYNVAAALLATFLLGSGPLNADEPTAEAAVRRALAKRVELKYEKQPLEQVAADLQAKLGVPVYLDPRPLADVGIATNTPVTFSIANVSAKAAIALMLRQLNLATVVRHESLMITTPEEAESMLDARVYDVADLGLPGQEEPDYDALTNVVTGCIRPETWDGVGGPGSIVPFHAAGIKVLVVSQTDQRHEEIECLLAELRATRDRKAKGGKSSSPFGRTVQPSGATVDPRLPRITEAEVAVRRALAKPVSFQFKKAPLGKVVTTLKEKTGLQIVVDVQVTGLLVLDPQSPPAENNDIVVSLDTPITAEAVNLALELALDRIVEPLALTWTYHHEVLVHHDARPRRQPLGHALLRRVRLACILRQERQGRARFRGDDRHDYFQNRPHLVGYRGRTGLDCNAPSRKPTGDCRQPKMEDASEDRDAADQVTPNSRSAADGRTDCQVAADAVAGCGWHEPSWRPPSSRRAGRACRFAATAEPATGCRHQC